MEILANGKTRYLPEKMYSIAKHFNTNKQIKFTIG